MLSRVLALCALFLVGQRADAHPHECECEEPELRPLTEWGGVMPPLPDAALGRHNIEVRQLHDDAPVTVALMRIPWTQKCQLRREARHTGFSFDAMIDEDGNLHSFTNVWVFVPLGTIEEGDVVQCLEAAARDAGPFDVSSGFVPGHEGAATVHFEYFLP